MIDMLNKRELRRLIERPNSYCISTYMPTQCIGPERQKEDQIRLKNLIKVAEHQLILFAPELRSPAVQQILAPAEKLLKERGHLRGHQSDGLAIFLSEDLSRIYRLPLLFEESVIVSDRFHITPLLPLLSGNGRFYILALSQNEVRLLQGTRYSIFDMELANIPASMAEALKWDDPERQLQWHTGTGARSNGGRSAIFHGHGVGSGEEHKDQIKRYLRQIGDGLQNVLVDESAPLLLASVDYLQAFYRKVNHYPYLMQEAISGNPETLSARELHRRAWPIVRPYFLQAQENAIDRCQQLSETNLITTDIREIVTAAHYGRVDILLAAKGRRLWGNYDPQTGQLQLHKESGPNIEDLINLAAIYTLLSNGMVYALSPAQIPGEAVIAAVLRY